MNTKRIKRCIAAVIATNLALILAPSAHAAVSPVHTAVSAVHSDNGVPIPAKLSRIISLSPTATEILFRVGAGKQVIAVDDQSDFPVSAPRTTLSGYNLNIEAVAVRRPDLVVMTYDPTPNQNALSAFAALHIPVLMQYAADDLRGTYAQIAVLGAVTGHTPTATSLIAAMKSAIAGVIKNQHCTKRIKVFHEIDNTLYSATSDTFIGHVYADLGLVNIADAAATADSYGYPQLSNEYIVKTNPDLIILTDGEYGESARTVAARPGWKTLAAVKHSRVKAISASVSSRWGPRVVDFYRAVGRIVDAINKDK
jgi:iron complex transport system substrate-binding protein